VISEIIGMISLNITKKEVLVEKNDELLELFKKFEKYQVSSSEIFDGLPSITKTNYEPTQPWTEPPSKTDSDEISH
jgi:negative regulator of sigma E activity